MDSQPNSSVDMHPFSHNEKCSNTQDNVETNSHTFSYSSMKDKMLSYYSGETLTDEDEKPAIIGNVTKHFVKKVEKIILSVFFLSNCKNNVNHETYIQSPPYNG